MADSTSTTATPSNDAESCSYQRTVSLYNWWLVKAKNDFQGKRLAVAGVSSRKDEAMRVFVSAPIIKRYDVFSLETADGKYVIISGFINEQRTLENGFDPQVFNYFLFGFPSNWESYALDFFREESTTGTDLGSAVPHIVSASCPEILSDGVEKPVPNSLISPEEAPGYHEKMFPENICNMSEEMGGVNVACSSGGSRCCTRLHNIKVYHKKQPASGGPAKDPDNENPTSVELGLRSPATPIQSQPLRQSSALDFFREESTTGTDLSSAVPHIVSASCPEILSDGTYSNDAGVEKPVPTSWISPEEAPGDHEKMFPENICNMSKEMGGVNVACSGGGSRYSTRLHDIKVCHKKKQPASGGPPKHSDNENPTSGALGLRSPATPIESQPLRQSSTPPEQLVKKSASRISRTSSPKTKGSYKKKRATVEKKRVTPKGKLNKSASAVKNAREKDLSYSVQGNQPRISIVSPQSLSFRKSRSGRLLLPPLEFWRNQIPIYNADHEITEIQEGASRISTCRGSSPSLSRFNN